MNDEVGLFLFQRCQQLNDLKDFLSIYDENQLCDSDEEKKDNKSEELEGIDTLLEI